MGLLYNSITKKDTSFKKYDVYFKGDYIWTFQKESSAFRFISALQCSNPDKYGETIPGSTPFYVKIVPIK